MRNHDSMKKTLVVAVTCLLMAGFHFFTADPVAAKRALTRKDAVLVAEKTGEAEAFYNLRGGYFRNCIEKKVMRPCETDWVTCVDHAWVVRFEIGKTCGIEHDGRLALTFLIDAVDGRIMSRFPEKDYFEKEDYCMIDADCLCSQTSDQIQTVSCSNFVYGQMFPGKAQSCGDCACRSNSCRPKP